MPQDIAMPFQRPRARWIDTGKVMIGRQYIGPRRDKSVEEVNTQQLLLGVGGNPQWVPMLYRIVRWLTPLGKALMVITFVGLLLVEPIKRLMAFF